MAINILFIFSITVKENLSNRVDKLEDRLSQVPLFRKEFDKELREILKGHLDDIKKKVIDIQQIFLQHLMQGKKSNVMHDLFLIYVTVNCRLYRIFIVLIFQKIVFYFFFPHVCLQIDQMRNILAEYARGNTQSVQMLARAHDMRYQAKV